MRNDINTKLNLNKHSNFNLEEFEICKGNDLFPSKLVILGTNNKRCKSCK